MGNVLHYLISDRGKYVVAHCLDRGLMATARSGAEEAVRRLDLVVRASLLVPGGLKKAPQEYWDAFDRADVHEEHTVEWSLSGFEFHTPGTREQPGFAVHIRRAL